MERIEVPEDLSPFVRSDGNTITLLGWRSISLVNIAAVLIPIIGGIVAVLVGGMWLVVSLAAFSFAAYGCWTIARGAKAVLEFERDAILIDGQRYKKSSIKKFVGKRSREPSGIDDVENSTELWVLSRDDNALPILQLSGAARIEKLEEFLNQLLGLEDE